MNDFISCADCDLKSKCIPLNGAFKCPYPVTWGGKSDREITESDWKLEDGKLVVEPRKETT